MAQFHCIASLPTHQYGNQDVVLRQQILVGIDIDYVHLKGKFIMQFMQGIQEIVTQVAIRT